MYVSIEHQYQHHSTSTNIHSFISDRDDLRSENQDDLMARIVELEKVIAMNLGKPPAEETKADAAKMRALAQA